MRHRWLKMTLAEREELRRVGRENNAASARSDGIEVVLADLILVGRSARTVCLLSDRE